MKLYTIKCNYWSAGDWYKWNELNLSMDATDSEIIGIYMTKEGAEQAFNEIESDEDFILDVTLYESIEFDMKEFLDEYDLTEDDMKDFSKSQWLEYFTQWELLDYDVYTKTIEHESPQLHGDEIIVAWEYYRYVGYAQRFKDIYTADELGFKCEDDLATGNEESTFRTNYSMLINHEEISEIKPEDLEDEILNRMRDWKWTHDSHYTREINEKFGVDKYEND